MLCHRGNPITIMILVDYTANKILELQEPLDKDKF